MKLNPTTFDFDSLTNLKATAEMSFINDIWLYIYL